jgi:protein TonB
MLRRAAPAALVLAAHTLLAWGLWSALLTLPSAGVSPRQAGTVVHARLVPSPPPPPPAAAAHEPARVEPPLLPVRQPARAVAIEAQAVATAELPLPVAEPLPAAWAPPAEARSPPAAPDMPAASVVNVATAAAPPTTALRRSAPDNTPCGRASYPALLHERGIEAVLRLRVHVSADGRATQVQVLASSGYRLFDEAALAQARACRFAPARIGDEPVDEWVEYPVRFALRG